MSFGSRPALETADPSRGLPHPPIIGAGRDLVNRDPAGYIRRNMVGGREYFELRCRRCSWCQVCGPEEVVGWLRKARKLRARSAPEWEILVELFLAAAPRLVCPECGAEGLSAGPAPDDAGDWPEWKTCASCNEPIEEDRLRAVPGATLCAACQRDEELGRGKREIDYCPRCGAPMELRPSRSGGVTRYVPACTANPPCRL